MWSLPITAYHGERISHVQTKDADKKDLLNTKHPQMTVSKIALNTYSHRDLLLLQIIQPYWKSYLFLCSLPVPC